MENEKKILGVSTLVVIALVIIAVASTYAFFKATEATGEGTPLQVTTNTTDSLMFNVSNDITFVADMSNFTAGAGNREGNATATAILKANNKTNTATDEYYLYLDIIENELTHVTASKTAELILQVSGPDGALGDGDLAGLNYVTVTDGKGVSISGFDITETKNLITIAKKKAITTTSETTDSWDIKVILVNLNEDQTNNGGKKFNAKIYVSKTTRVLGEFCTDQNLATCLSENYELDSHLLYHSSSLANSAGDNSYRYAGSYEAVNNYVCFGSDEATCPHDNLYRIIGVFGDQVKLIKADYAKSTLLGTSGDYKSDYETAGYGGTNKGSNSKSEIGGYYWNYNNGTSTNANIWANSKLNKENLNGTYLNGLGTAWQSKIAMTTWKVGGNTYANIEYTNPSTAYQNEIVSPAENTTESKKIGLMYVSDYYYGASQNNWTKHGYTTSSKPHSSGEYGEEYDYRSAINENWMYGGLYEWTISRDSDNDHNAFYVSYVGGVTYDNVYYRGFAVRPVFYLESNVVKGVGSGTASDPMRIQL